MASSLSEDLNRAAFLLQESVNVSTIELVRISEEFRKLEGVLKIIRTTLHRGPPDAWSYADDVYKHLLGVLDKAEGVQK